MFVSNNWNRSKIAFCVRITLFFGIPILYILIKYNTININNESETNEKETSGPSIHRHLLGLIEQGDKNCSPAAILEFPSDGLTKLQRQNGYIAIHCVLAVYCFLLLGIVCEQYFVPSMEIICERFQMQSDIVGATFMATASSSPELFLNCIGTFITEGDLGVGAIVGSAVFNILAVPALCALIAGKVIELDWWSISRDSLMYALAVVALISTMLDDKIYWFEALLMILMYTCYVTVMVYDGLLGKIARTCCPFSNGYSETTPLISEVNKNYSNQTSIDHLNNVERGNCTSPDAEYTSMTQNNLIWSWPEEDLSGFQKLYWIVSWPIRVLLWATIPDCKKYTRLYLVSLTMCMVWIGGVSYLVAWIITIIGDTLNYPDSITGLTILAAGSSIPEAVSSVLVTIKGHGTMGVTNVIGSNTFDVLLCLGLPWFVKSVFFPTHPGNHWVAINSSGLSYSAISLLSTLIAFYLALVINKFQLDWKLAVMCILLYASFITMASVLELNMIFPVNLPTCAHY